MPEAGYALCEEADGPLTVAIDRTKYASRFPEADKDAYLGKATDFLRKLVRPLLQGYIFVDKPRLADLAIFPFERQFTYIDKGWFDARKRPCVHLCEERFLASELFLNVMQKYHEWQNGNAMFLFPQTA